MKLHKSFLSIVIICVDDHKWFLNNILAEDFKTFLSEVEEGDLKKEYLLPNIVDKLLKEGRANVKVLETQDRWFGVTYQEDKEAVQKAFAGLIKEGVYPANLWG